MLIHVANFWLVLILTDAVSKRTPLYKVTFLIRIFDMCHVSINRGRALVPASSALKEVGRRACATWYKALQSEKSLNPQAVSESDW